MCFVNSFPLYFPIFHPDITKNLPSADTDGRPDMRKWNYLELLRLLIQTKPYLLSAVRM